MRNREIIELNNSNHNLIMNNNRLILLVKELVDKNIEIIDILERRIVGLEMLATPPGYVMYDGEIIPMVDLYSKIKIHENN